MSLTAFGRKWSLYLDYLNAVHLLLAAARQPFLQSLGVMQFIGEVTLTNAIVFHHFFDDPLHRSEPRLCRFTWAPEDGSVMAEKHSTLQCPPMHVHRAVSVLPPGSSSCWIVSINSCLGAMRLIVRLLAMVARAVHAYYEMSYDTCPHPDLDRHRISLARNMTRS